MSASATISALARSFLAGEQTVEAVEARAVRTLGRPWRWLHALAVRYVEAFDGRTRPRHREAIRFLLEDSGFRRARVVHRDKLAVAEWLMEPTRMQPVDAAKRWDLPVIETVADLADWLSLHEEELEWFTDLKGLCNKSDNSKLRHYRYEIRAKRSSGIRLIEIPKRDLKDLQRRILSSILDRVPPHDAVHGFVRGRSIVTFAAPHVRQRILLRLDLENFFPTFPAARVQAFFRTLGYPEPVADRLGGICTNATPRSVWNNRPLEAGPKHWGEARVLYTRRHLPQGASFRAVGPLAGGPDQIHLALKDALTSEGTLIMYASCPRYCDEVGRGNLTAAQELEILEKLPAFDARTARADRDNGALVECLRTYPGSRVNEHVARFLVWGKHARHLISEQPWNSAFGQRSCLDRFLGLNGKILLLGSDHDAVTFLHYVEHVADFPGKRIARFRVPVQTGCHRIWREMEEFDTSEGAHANWPENFFATLVDGYLSKTENRAARVGDAVSCIFTARGLFEYAAPIMEAVAKDVRAASPGSLG